MARRAAKSIADKAVATLVIKPKKGEYLLPVMTVKMRLPLVLVVDMMHRSGRPPTPEQVREMAHPPKRTRGRPKRSTSEYATYRARLMAYEVVRLERTGVATERAKELVHRAYAKQVRTVEAALTTHRAEGEAHQTAYVQELVRLGKLTT